ncbi:ribosomal protein uL16 3-hydroxylase [Entomomonas asaccharolytica]|uniref:Cupin domain-containing protein n=1 Tax=Entomomonas asaccharolytica TaxID=2785331 RepID=A0A974NDU5_9GAMM|nr:cupin domain-containing protein [Entomomonas asaccharolytica]QQP84557.1 cupin domain-containing protein [Entomomonas asaccharolytica]
MQIDQPLTLLGGISPSTFMQEYWQRKPLLVRGAFTNFKNPINPDELAGLSLEEEIESRIVIEHGNTPWELLHGPFVAETFQNLPETNWTLLVQAVDQFIPEVAQLFEPFSFIPKWRFDDIMISYAAKGGSVGPHFDYYDVFLIQSHGQRRWKIGPQENSQSPRLDHPDLRLLADFKQTDEWLLEPGDMLYLPPQFAHYGIAETDCMTISVGLRAPSTQEILIHYTDYLSQFYAEEFRYNDLEQKAVTKDPHFIDEAALTRLKKTLQEALQDDQKLLTWFGQHVTEPRYPERLMGETLTEQELVNTIDNGAIVIRNPSGKLAWSIFNDEAILFASGFSRSFSTHYADLLRLICETNALYQENLQAWLKDPIATTLLTELIKQGTLEFFNE